MIKGEFADGIYHERLLLGCEMNYERFLGNFARLHSRDDTRRKQKSFAYLSRCSWFARKLLVSSSTQLIIINDISVRFVNFSNNSRRLGVLKEITFHLKPARSTFRLFFLLLHSVVGKIKINDFVYAFLSKLNFFLCIVEWKMFESYRNDGVRNCHSNFLMAREQETKSINLNLCVRNAFDGVAGRLQTLECLQLQIVIRKKNYRRATIIITTLLLRSRTSTTDWRSNRSFKSRFIHNAPLWEINENL